MSAFEIEAYDPSRRDAYLGLLHDAWGDGAMRGDVFDWWLGDNPSGSLMSVAVIDDEVVGVASHTLAVLSIRGEERLGQYSVHAVTSERARGLGVFRSLELHHEELGAARGSACVLAFASFSTREIFLGPLGWSQIERPRAWARPLRGMAERRLRRGGRPGPGERPPDRDGIARIERFGPEQEALYRSLTPWLGNHLVRSERYLNWRYVDSPRPYQAFGGADGFAVLGHTQRGRLATALVMELLAPPGRVDALLDRCIAEASGDDVLVAVPSPLLPTAKLARHGFVPVRTRLDYMGIALAGPLDPRPGAWALSLGDTDFF
jgi:hypothetical protein